MTTPKPRKNAPGAGRPSKLVGARCLNIYLDAESVQTAQLIGQGNVSEGVRLALKMVKAATPPATPAPPPGKQAHPPATPVSQQRLP